MTGISEMFFMKMETFFVVSFKIAPKFTILVSNFKFGKHNYPTSSIVYLWGWSGNATLILPFKIPETLSILKLGSNKTLTLVVAPGYK